MWVREVSSLYQTIRQLNSFAVKNHPEMNRELTGRDQEQDRVGQEPNSLHPFPSVKLVINQESRQIVTTK
jgi:hypothetical protein